MDKFQQRVNRKSCDDFDYQKSIANVGDLIRVKSSHFPMLKGETEGELLARGRFILSWEWWYTVHFPENDIVINLFGDEIAEVVPKKAIPPPPPIQMELEI